MPLLDYDTMFLMVHVLPMSNEISDCDTEKGKANNCLYPADEKREWVSV